MTERDFSARAALLLPRPRRVQPTNADWVVPAQPAIRVASALPEVERSARHLALGLEALGWRPQLGPDRDSAIVVGLDPRLTVEAQGYELHVAGSGVRIIGRDGAGLHYGVTTLLQWIALHRRENPVGPLKLAGVAVEDWPDFLHRGVLLDISRDKVPTMQTLRSLVDLLAGWKVNQLQLYTEHTFAYRGHEAVWRDASPILPEEARELDAYCRARHVELVPNQNSFGHFHRWLVHEPYRRLAECPDGIDHPFSDVAEPFSLCPIDPGSIALLSDLYDQLLPNFSSGQVNVGLDETLDLGRCRSAAACQREGREEVYLRFVGRVHELVQQRGRRMQLWADILLDRPDLLSRLPRDVVALAWGYEADHPFDEQLQHLARAGLPFYVCPGTSSWNSLAGRAGNALLNIERAAASARRHGASGILLTDWGDNGHLQPLPSSFIGLLSGAAAGWNADASPTEGTIAELLDAHVFRDVTGHAGRALLQLATAHRACGASPKNGSALFRLLVSSADPLTHERYAGLTAEGLAQSHDRIAEAISALDAATIGHPDAELIGHELRWVAGLLQLACDLGRSRLAVGEGAPLSAVRDADRVALHEKLTPLIAQHEPLWLARNRPGGRRDSIRRLERLHQAIAGQ